MPAPIKVPFLAHFDFTALPSIRVMESFSLGLHVYAGVQNGVWPYDEYYWSERKGAWGGVLPMPARESVGNLRLLGATREEFGDFDEPLDRVATGTTLKALSETLYRYDFYTLGVPDGAAEYRLYSCATGALAATAGTNGALGVLADGSYILWARTFAGEPFESGHGLARIKDGEWSALRVVVGSGVWSVAAGVCPSPGAALYRKTSNSGEAALTLANEATYRVLFDPLARCVSASCKLEQGIHKKDGTFLVPAGSTLIGGLRASSSGPQTALWVLHTDGTARLLGLQTDFTDGVCECAKTNHFASDVVQAPWGEVFVLTECALFRFDPDAETIYEALQGYPPQSLTPSELVLSEDAHREPGHPGGNCLRFPGGLEMAHFTENLAVISADLGGVNDGKAHYNRMVRRINGRDVSGPSTLWHGTNCCEVYLGRFWAIRSDDNETLYLDWLDNGRWHGYNGMSRDMTATFWQRLVAVGSTLFVFGFNPSEDIPLDADNHTAGLHPVDPKTGLPTSTDATAPQDGAQVEADTPVCAVANGLALRDAAFPYFIRRATVRDEERLFVTARDGDTGIGPANRVVEIVVDQESGGGTRICSFWSSEDAAFLMGREDFEDAGGDVTKLPAYFSWKPMPNTNGGGKWRASEVVPSTDFYLQTVVGETTILFEAKPSGALPYDPDLWGRLCFSILADGSIDTENGPSIEPTCTDAQCALESLPEGTKFRVVECPVFDSANPITAIQVTDASDAKRLSAARDQAPLLWMRIDSDAALNDRSSYTYQVNYGRLIPLPKAAKASVEVIVLVRPTDAPLKAHELHIVSRRA